MASSPFTLDELVAHTANLRWCPDLEGLVEPKTDPFTHTNLSLVGCIVFDKPLHKVGVRAAISQSWHFVSGLEMEETNDQKLIFTFPLEETLNRVLFQALWNIKGHLLILKAWKRRETVQDIDLSTTPIWLQSHGLPLELISNFAKKAASRVGKVLSVDFRS